MPEATSSHSSVPFTDALLHSRLHPRLFRFYPSIGSTNDVALEWLEQGAPSGAVVLSDEQIAGRGRFARRWVAPPATALLMSVILRPAIQPDRIHRVAMVGAVAILEAIGSWGARAPGLISRLALKWPNDVLLDGRKLAGILPEAAWHADQLVGVVLGMGLNVSVPFEKSPLAQTAISLADAAPGPIDRAALLSHILDRVDYWAGHIADADLTARWRDALSTLGQPVTVHFGDGQVLSGLAADVDDDGALQLQDAQGTMHRVLAGEVTLNPPA